MTPNSPSCDICKLPFQYLSVATQPSNHFSPHTCHTYHPSQVQPSGWFTSVRLAPEQNCCRSIRPARNQMSAMSNPGEFSQMIHSLSSLPNSMCTWFEQKFDHVCFPQLPNINQANNHVILEHRSHLINKHSVKEFIDNYGSCTAQGWSQTNKAWQRGWLSIRIIICAIPMRFTTR